MNYSTSSLSALFSAADAIGNKYRSQPLYVGDIVRVIDEGESPQEWAKFRVQSLSGVLYQLVPLDRPFLYQKPLYVINSEIVSDSIFSASWLKSEYRTFPPIPTK